jgi:hypothetical protein
MDPPELSDLPRAYRIGLRLRALGADDELIGDCLGMDPAGVSTLIEIGRRKLASERRLAQLTQPNQPNQPKQIDHSDSAPDSPPGSPPGSPPTTG